MAMLIEHRPDRDWRECDHCSRKAEFDAEIPFESHRLCHLHLGVFIAEQVRKGRKWRYVLHEEHDFCC
jgi:hypothetical protein